MYQFPEKLKRLVPYEPLTGSYPVRLDANESFLPPPDWLREEIAKAVSAVDFNRYPDPYCVTLCERFAGFFGVPASEVVAGNGSDELIGLIVSSFTTPGESMVVVQPDFSMYAFYAQMCGVRLAVFDKAEHALALDVDALLSFAREKDARLLILSNPCNPTSLAASREEVRRIVEGLPDCLCVIDEAYMDFAEGSVLDFAAEKNNLIVLKTCSKAFGMAGIRLGFAVAHPTLTIALKAVKSPYNVNSMTQAVGAALFSHPDYLKGCIERIKRSRDALYGRIAALQPQKAALREVLNTRANFVFLCAENPQKLSLELARRGIAIRCMPPYLRVSAGSEAENQAVAAALAELLD